METLKGSKFFVARAAASRYWSNDSFFLSFRNSLIYSLEADLIGLMVGKKKNPNFDLMMASKL